MKITKEEILETGKIVVPLFYSEDEDGKIIYDFEEMANYFELSLSKLDENSVVICRVDFK